MVKYMLAFDKQNNSLTTDLNIDYSSQFRLSKKYNWKSLRPIYGCPHGCWYCYVKSSDKSKFRYLPADLHDKVPRFSRDVYIVENNVKKIEQFILDDIKKWAKNKEKYLHMSFCSDPFPYSKNNELQYREIVQNTLDIMKMVNWHWYRIEFISKWIFPVDEIMKIDTEKVNCYWFSVPTLDFDYSDKFEPLASPIRERIESAKKLDEAWFKIWVNIAPLFLWKLINKNKEVKYEFKTWVWEIYDFLNWFTNIHQLRIETLRWRNNLKNEISMDELKEVEEMFYKVIKEKNISRYFLDLGFNKQSADMDFCPKANLFHDEAREKLKQKINKIKNTFIY